MSSDEEERIDNITVEIDGSYKNRTVTFAMAGLHAKNVGHWYDGDEAVTLLKEAINDLSTRVDDDD